MRGALFASLAWLATAASLVAQAAPAVDRVALTVAPERPRVGDRVVVTATLPVVSGEAVRFARPPDFDAAFARIVPLLAPATSRTAATLRIEMVAAAAGTFRVGPFALSVGASEGTAAGADPGSEARALETGTLDVEVARSWPADRSAGFDEWRGPLRSTERGATRAWPWLVIGAALLGGAALLVAGWIALRRRFVRALEMAPPASPAAVRSWRDELGRLAANIPESVAARRLWWSDLARVVRDELALRSRDDSPDRTTEELAAVAADGLRDELVALLRVADDGKFARASATVAAASSAVTVALRRLDDAEARRCAGPP